MKASGSEQAISNVEKYILSQNWSIEARKLTFEEIYSQLPTTLEPFYPAENLELCLFQRLKEPGNLPSAAFDLWLKRALNSGHPILTTNYDTVIEWALGLLSITPFGPGGPNGELDLVDYGVPDDLCLPLPSAGSVSTSSAGKVLILKLYGSVTWSQCRKCRKYVLERINEAVAEDAHMGRGICTGPSCGGRRHRAVFVPLAGKKTADDQVLDIVWTRAERVLSESRHIVFAGFSLHQNDQSIRALLKRAYSAGHTDRVTVVLNQNNAEILKRYREIYSDRVESYDQGWKQYLKE